jgi:GT2 family glycosyltransferase
MDCTVLVPTYFGNQLVSNCLSSLLSKVPNVKVLIYKNDEGWLKACNRLMASLNTDIVLLNDDTFVLTDIVTEMQTLAYSDPSIGIVGGMALSPDTQTVINYGIYISPDGNTAHKYFGKDVNSVTDIEIQKSVEGSCMFIKREVLDKIGLFDEGYGMGYREELDLCFRAREAGYKVVSTPNAKYVHFVSQTNGPLSIHNSTYDYFMSKWGTKLKLGLI